MAEDKNAALIAEACKAYGIGKEYIFASAVKPDGTVVIVTVGGKKVRYRTGDRDIAPLDSISVTGVNPKPKRKPITGAKKE